MNRAELAAGTLVLVFGAALLAGALGFPFILAGIPGPGFLPLLIGAGIVAAGTVLVTAAARGRVPAPGTILWPPLAGWVRVAFLLGALAVSFLLLETLGFLLVSTLFMAAMIYALGGRSWTMLTLVPVLSAGLLYGVFAVWLRVPLPKGLLTLVG